MIPTINKPARVTRETTTANDHILTNQLINANFKTTIFKTDISDHIPVCIVISSAEKIIENKHTYANKREITDEATERFNRALLTGLKHKLVIIHLNVINYLKIFFTIYENFFPRKKIKLKHSKPQENKWN